jgi:hypothetical protein
MKRLLYLFAALFFCLLGIAAWYGAKFTSTTKQTARFTAPDEKLTDRLRVYLDSAAHYAESNKLNSNICFLADMQISSGRYRFFVADLKNNTIVAKGLVAHGSCNEVFSIHPAYSNVPESSCTSTGRYRVGKSYNGRFGKSYLLYGLDSSNSLALRRHVVLHAFSEVPEQETFPLPICNSRGCPMVSTQFFNKLQSILDTGSRPVLLWILE